MEIPQGIAIMISCLLLVIAIAISWWCVTTDDYSSAFKGLVVPIVVIMLALSSFIWSLSDNYQHVDSGTVIAQKFTDDYYSYVLSGKVLVPIYHPDDWALELLAEDGRTGKVHFKHDVFEQYPVGSHYPD